MQATVAVFPGDGIGVEVTAEARQCLDLCAQRIGFRLHWVEGCIGGAAIDRFGLPLPEEALRRARCGCDPLAP
jgi:3-isopropylmalate dehydrogenase